MRGKVNVERYFKFLIYLVVIILINLVGMNLFARFDLTENKIYSLSQASREAVSTLSEPLTINVFFTENLPAPHNSTARYLRDLVEEYDIYANRYFNFRFYDVSPQEDAISGKAEENRKLAESYGINPVQIRMIEADEVKFKNAYMGLVVIHGDLMERIPAITSTDGLEYKLTAAIEKLNNKISTLAGLPGKIDIKLVMSSSLDRVAPYINEDNLTKLPKMIEQTVAELNKKNYNRLNYSFVDPETEDNFNSLLEKYDIVTLQWPDLPEKGVESGQGSIGLLMSYGDSTRSIRLLDIYRLPILGTQYELMDMATLEETINENIETLIGINEDLGYLADHGTLEMADPMGMNQQQNPARQPLGNFETLVSKSYSLRPVELADEPIPDSLNSLIIAHPTEPFTEYELYQIDQALMRGTNLIIFSDAFVAEPNAGGGGFNMGPSYRPLDTGLEKLLAHYGVKIEPAYVMDKKCYKQAGNRGGEQPIHFAPIIQKENINHEVNFLKNINGMITLNHSPVSVDAEILEKKDIIARKLFSSSDQSWLMKDRIMLNPMLINPPPDEDAYQSQPLAWVLEGGFSSYFSGKPVPVKNPGDQIREESREESMKTPAESGQIDLSGFESKNQFLENSRPAKLLVVGSSAMLGDNLLDAKGQSPNAAFVLNAIDAMNGRSEIAAMRSKTQQFNPLNETTAMARGFVKGLNIAGLPVLVIVFGLGVWWNRRIKRRRIRMMFAPRKEIAS